jgi:hypothetical protein
MLRVRLINESRKKRRVRHRKLKSCQFLSTIPVVGATKGKRCNPLQNVFFRTHIIFCDTSPEDGIVIVAIELAA